MSLDWNLNSSYGWIKHPRNVQISDMKPPTRPKIRSNVAWDHWKVRRSRDCTNSAWKNSFLLSMLVTVFVVWLSTLYDASQVPQSTAEIYEVSIQSKS